MKSLLLSPFFIFNAQDNSMLALSAIAMAEGYMEYRVYSGGYRGSGPRVFNWLRANYHIPLGIKWATICVLLNEPEFFPLFTVLEDISFQVSAGKWPTESSWISKLGGFRIGSIYMPVAYLIGAGLTIILYQIF